jgi:hypothetical protein
MGRIATVVDPYRSAATMAWCEGCKRWIGNPWAHAACLGLPLDLIGKRFARRPDKIKVKVVSVTPHKTRAVFVCVLECGHEVQRTRYQTSQHTPRWAWCRECP